MLRNQAEVEEFDAFRDLTEQDHDIVGHFHEDR